MSDHDLPRYPRSLNQLHAAVFGFFWLPCPLCGTYFGGHEAEVAWWPDLTSVGHSICWKHGGDVYSVARYGRNSEWLT